MVTNVSFIMCKICGKVVPKNSNRQKYCKTCAKKKHRKQSREYKKRRRELGTSDISQHKHDDLQYEEFEIRQELKRLGFKRQFT